MASLAWATRKREGHPLRGRRQAPAIPAELTLVRSINPLMVAAAMLASGVAMPTAAATVGHDAFAREVVRLINLQRGHHGRLALVRDLRLDSAALGHSVDMADHDFFSHTGTGSTTACARITTALYSWSVAGGACGENIAAGYRTSYSVMYGTDNLNDLSAFDLTRGGDGFARWDEVGQGWDDADWDAWAASRPAGSYGWMGSSGHRANVLSSLFRDVGVGIAYNATTLYDWYWTQDFGAGNSRGLPGNRRSDVDADGKADLLWRHQGSGANSLWRMNGVVPLDFTPLPTVADTNWQLVATGDVDGDGSGDLVWRHTVNGWNSLWRMNGGTPVQFAMLPTVSDTAWELVGTGDVDGDQQTDLIWRHQATGANSVWRMNGVTPAEYATLPTVPDTAWRVVGVGDLDGDGDADLIWRHQSSGANSVWLMKGVTPVQYAMLPTVNDPGWQVAAVGDVDGDGRADLVWRHGPSGAVSVWRMNGVTPIEFAMLPPVADTLWDLVGAMDFDGDGKADLLWRHQGTGLNSIWRMNGVAPVQYALLPTVTDVGWQPQH